MRLINDLGHHPSLDCRRLRSVEARRFRGVESQLLGQMVIVKSVVLSLG